MNEFIDPRLPFTFQIPEDCRITKTVNPMNKTEPLIEIRNNHGFRFNIIWGKSNQPVTRHTIPSGYKYVDQLKIGKNHEIDVIVARWKIFFIIPVLKFAFTYRSFEYVFTANKNIRNDVENMLRSICL